MSAGIIQQSQVKDGTMEETKKTISKSIQSLLEKLFLSLTWGNDKEGVYHTKIRNDYNIKAYYNGLGILYRHTR